MPKVHSHYENLKVARNATAEDIRAAYRSLTRKHHPDRNPDDADAERVMSVINVAYGVLSDPVKRLEHDRWIVLSEAPVPVSRGSRERPTLHKPAVARRQRPFASEEPNARRAQRRLFKARARRVAAHLARFGVLYGMALIAAIYYAVPGTSAPVPPGLASADARKPSTARATGGYAPAALAPNGRSWPASSGYVDGYALLNKGGLSQITVDNSANDTDIFGKLVSLDGPTAAPVRTFLVRAHSRFTLAELTVGTYDLRYRNLGNGSLARSPAFIVEEVGTQHSAVSMPVHIEDGGSLHAFSLGEADF